MTRAGLAGLLLFAVGIGSRPGTSHVVAMQGNRFRPDHLEIGAGDTVLFVMRGGGPHNVAFWPDSVPPGGAGPLAVAMPDTIGPLMGLLLLDGESYRVVFGGVPAGSYRYYCLPHLDGGMRGEIVVRTPP